ncbi:MAG TPA: glycosyltransferase [Candidatus Tidjanibacter gallistercoris]|nr:glycosyltransferase [Candidatus Tidjanibacter gallistercoris]
MQGKKLSLIIATYNRGGKLCATLDSLLVQTLPQELWEAVVVNNNSTDDTAERFAAYAAAHPELDVRMVEEPVQGVSAARNRGIAESRGEYIVVIDDDETVVPVFLERYYDLFESEPGTAAAGGRILPGFEGVPPRWMSPYTERAIAGTLDLGGRVREFPEGKFFGGGNHGYRRSVVARYGGYDTALGRTGTVLLAGEEKEFYGRLRAGGERIVYLPDAVIYHLVDAGRLTRGYFVRLCRNIGRSERRRTLAASRGAFAVRLVAEAVKWAGAAVLAAGYLLRGAPARGGYLLLMRWQITAGLLGA